MFNQVMLVYFLRRHLQSLLKSMLAEEEITHTLVKPLLNLYVQLHQNAEPRINELIEVISDIRMPITTVESQVSKEEQRKVELKVSLISCFLPLRTGTDGWSVVIVMAVCEVKYIPILPYL